MSGPKVVRVVTKQEVMATCRSHMRALEDAIEQWRKYASSKDVLTEEEEKSVARTLLSINKMFEREQFLEVQKQCNVEIAALNSDRNRIRDEAIAKAALERSTRRRLQYSAETLIRTFQDAGSQIPEELSDITRSVITANEEQLADIGSTLSRILAEYALSSEKQNGVTQIQKELSAKLAEGEKLQTLEDWKILQNDNNKEAAADCRLDKLLAEIEISENKSVAEPYLDRITIIAKEPSQNRRSLLTDSLILDLVAHTNERKVKEQVIASMREVRCELRGLTSNSAKEIEFLLTRAIDSQDVSSSKILNDKAKALIKVEAKANAGASRREVILKGLTELGYEVREDMVTGWVKNGRIVVRKPDEKHYGVELRAAEEVERVQVRLVSFDQSSDVSNVSRDLDRETIWCSEFTHLKSILEESGAALHIEKALPVGAKPLKRVHESSTTIPPTTTYSATTSRSRRDKDSPAMKKISD